MKEKVHEKEKENLKEKGNEEKKEKDLRDQGLSCQY